MLAHYNGKPPQIWIFLSNSNCLFRIHSEYKEISEDKRGFECVVNPGETLYIPDWWWHATLNIGETVFISTFV